MTKKTTNMGPIQENTDQRAIDFPPDKIRLHLDKIFRDEHFASSETLKTFLGFIVEEKLQGRENCLKEYTIAVKVLKKGITFKPQENCIVRIHAVRLRKALASYYAGSGAMDEIRISLPKGSYVPQFSDNVDMMLSSVFHKRTDDNRSFVNGRPFTAAVIPFHHMERNQLVKSFSDGLGIQLSAALMNVKDLTVISYNMIRRVPEKFTDVKDIGSLYDAQYIFTGDVQCQKNLVRVTVQLIRSDNHEQVWSQMFEKKVTTANSFKMQDEIIAQVIRNVEEPSRMLKGKPGNVAVMAVA
jgi:TolB-like protein